MQDGDGLCGCIAFSEEGKNEIEASGLVRKEYFGRYIPWKDSIDGALGAVTASGTKEAARAARNETTWQILLVRNGDTKLGNAFVKNRIDLSRDSGGRKGWNWKDDFVLARADEVQWLTVTHPPIGVTVWAEKAGKPENHKGRCSRCSGMPVPVWKEWSSKELLCASCWNDAYQNPM